MSKPNLIACALAGALAAAASHADESAVTTATTGAMPAPPWAAPQPRPAPPLPDWVKQRRADLGVEETATGNAAAQLTIAEPATDAPTDSEVTVEPVEPVADAEPGSMPSGMGSYERPAIPDWVIEQRARMTQQTRPEAPMRPEPPQPPEWVKPNPPAGPAGYSAVAPMREVSGAPTGPTWVIERPVGPAEDQATVESPEAGAVARLAIEDVAETPERPEPPARPELPETSTAANAVPAFAPPDRPAPMQAPAAPARPPMPERPDISASMPTPMAPERPQPPAQPYVGGFTPLQMPTWAEATPAPMVADAMPLQAEGMMMAPEAMALPEFEQPETGPAGYPAPWGSGYPGGGYPGWGYPGGGYPGWGYPGGGWGNGWMPWNSGGWGNNWMPWGNSWGNDWMPWGSGWGNDWSDGYGAGDGWGGLGSDGYGGGSGEADFSFAMSGRASADMTGYGRGDGYGDGWGRGWGYQGYGYPGYGYPAYYPAMPMMPADDGMIEADDEPADGDADGVADASDLCPETAPGMSVDALGCDIEARIVLQGVNFKTDSDELTESSLAILDGVSTTLSAHPEISVVVAGHTDSDGDDAYNKDLSQRRAQRVVDYLANNGVDGNNMTAKGFGEEQPIATNDTAEGKAANRRVELNRL